MPYARRKIIAMDTYSRQNDDFFGQWLSMHVPFRHLTELIVPSVIERVPKHLMYFACCLHHKPDYWNDDAKIDQDMQMEGHRQCRTDTFLARVRCLRELISRYKNGALDKNDAEAEHIVAAELDPQYADRSFRDGHGELQQYTLQQRLLKGAIRKYIDELLAAEQARSDEDYNDLVQKLKE
jgi:hypothetical protein